MPPNSRPPMPDGDHGDLTEEPPAFMSALVTEHFSLQSISSATISESGSRAALYLSALSSGLVAIGFASSSRQDLEALAFSVLPTVFVLGWFTIMSVSSTPASRTLSAGAGSRISASSTPLSTPATPNCSNPTRWRSASLECATAADRSFSLWPA